MSEFISIGLFKNNRREKDTQPQLSNGKPQDIHGVPTWVSLFINSQDPDRQKRIAQMIDALTEENGGKPIFSISLRRAEQKSPPSSQQRPAKRYDDDDPF